MSNWNSVCDAIHARMAELELTVEDMARETGLMRWTVRNLKACRFRDKELDGLDAVLQLPPGWLWQIAYGLPSYAPVPVPPPPTGPVTPASREDRSHFIRKQNLAPDLPAPITPSALRLGPTRRSELLPRIAGVSDKVLTESLRRLASRGLVTRAPDGEPARKRGSAVYQLSRLGGSFANGPLAHLA